GWAVERGRRAIRLSPHGRVVLQTQIAEHDSRAARMLAACAFAPAGDRESFFSDLSEIRMDELGLPPGVRLTTIREHGGAGLYRACAEAFGWSVNAEGEQALKYWQESSPDYDPDLRFVAAERDKVVGYSLCSSRSSEFTDT